MGDTIERAVERVIASMQDNLGEPLTIDHLARTAMFSKFHFSRIFQRVTGVSPGRFLSAMRLQEAKRLLVTTDLNVADISLRVGYTSVGTFSSRFSRSVGMSPTAYRRLGGYAPDIPNGPVGDPPGEPARGFVQGTVRLPPFHRPGLVFVGLFPERVPEGRPVSCTVLTHPGPFRLDAVPEGTWYLLANSITADAQEDVTYPLAREQMLAVGTLGPLTIRRDAPLGTLDLRLRPVRSIDPPVLMALLNVRKAALEMVADRRRAA